jgi:hypothetical protein
MSLRHNYVNILARLLPAGAVGVSTLLGSAAPGIASEHPIAAQPAATDRDPVGERLAAIREAVSAIAGPHSSVDKPARGDQKLAWGNWWNNWGFYRPWGWGWPNWNNWRNWNNWHNWWNNW